MIAAPESTELYATLARSGPLELGFTEEAWQPLAANAFYLRSLLDTDRGLNLQPAK